MACVGLKPLKSGSRMLRYLTLSAFRSAEATGNKGIVPTTAGYKKLMEQQKFFLTDNGRMVWEKTSFDRGLYGLTLAGVIGGSCFMVYKIFYMIYPKK